ncbi:MAG: YitT family protein [Anaerovorax sp.]
MKKITDEVMLLVKMAMGCVLISLAINVLYIPNKLLGGGVNGISMLVHIFTGADTGLVYFICNVPIFIIGFLALPKKFMIYALYGLCVFSAALSLTAGFSINSDSPLSTILLGGTIYGVGMGLVYGAGGCTGGIDIIGKIVYRKYAVSIATVGFAINLVVISISMYFFGVDISVQTLAAMFVASKVCDFVIDGMNHKRMVFIISEDKDEELAAGILEELGRGVTMLQGEGGYTGKKKKVIYCVIGATQVALLREVVKKIDEKAFVTITETAQVYGNGRGFYNMKDDL